MKTVIITAAAAIVYIGYLALDRHRRREEHYRRRREQRRRELERRESGELRFYLLRRELLPRYEENKTNRQTVIYKGCFTEKEKEMEHKKGKNND